MTHQRKKFLLIASKIFDVVYEGKNMQGLRISENKRGFKVSMSLDEEDVAQLVDVLEDFYWKKACKAWGKNKVGRNPKLAVALARNQNGRILLLSADRGKAVKKYSFWRKASRGMVAGETGSF